MVELFLSKSDGSVGGDVFLSGHGDVFRLENPVRTSSSQPLCMCVRCLIKLTQPLLLLTTATTTTTSTSASITTTTTTTPTITTHSYHYSLQVPPDKAKMARKAANRMLHKLQVPSIQPEETDENYISFQQTLYHLAHNALGKPLNVMGCELARGIDEVWQQFGAVPPERAEKVCSTAVCP